MEKANGETTFPIGMELIDEGASLREVILAINAEREQKRAMYLAPSLQWLDIERLCSETA